MDAFCCPKPQWSRLLNQQRTTKDQQLFFIRRFIGCTQMAVASIPTSCSCDEKPNGPRNRSLLFSSLLTGFAQGAKKSTTNCQQLLYGRKENARVAATLPIEPVLIARRNDVAIFHCSSDRSCKPHYPRPAKVHMDSHFQPSNMNMFKSTQWNTIHRIQRYVTALRMPSHLPVNIPPFE